MQSTLCLWLYSILTTICTFVESKLDDFISYYNQASPNGPFSHIYYRGTINTAHALIISPSLNTELKLQNGHYIIIPPQEHTDIRILRNFLEKYYMKGLAHIHVHVYSSIIILQPTHL